MMEESILCAATWFKDFETPVHNCINIDKGIVLCGYRHGHIYGQINKMTNKMAGNYGEHEQGFLTSKNRFVDRKEAREIFIKNGGKPDFNDELYSEDLY